MKNYLIIGVLLVSISLCITVVAYQVNKEEVKHIESIPSNTFYEFIEKNPDAKIIDIRTKQEYMTYHLDNSINIDYYSPDFKNELKQLDKDETYIIYCRSGNRSKDAKKIMEELGFKNVYELDDGIIKCC